MIIITIKMRRDLRPKSARCQHKNSQSQAINLSPDLRAYPTTASKTQSQFVAGQGRNIPIYRERHPEEPTESQKESRPLSSSSKLLKKYEKIKAYRSTKNSVGDDFNFQEEISELVTKKRVTQVPKYRKASENQVIINVIYPELGSLQGFKNRPTRMNRLDKSPRPKSSCSVVELPQIQSNDLIFQKESSESRSELLAVSHGIECARTAFWRSQNKFVTLFPLQKNQNLNYQHDHILPVYAELSVQGKRYVVSDEYRNCSLRQLTKQFGPFPEVLAKRYLKQITLGVQHLHFNKKGHNHLNPNTILYDKHGSLFINMLQSTAILRNKEDISKALHWYSPESLAPKGSRSFKNDIWALGCLAIQMLTGCDVAQSPLHPYNFPSHNNHRQATMIDNLQQRYPCFSSGGKPVQTQQTSVKMSQGAINFIQNCLQILQEKRPEAMVILELQFFE